MPRQSTKVPRVCEHCGATFLVHRCRAKAGEGRFCGMACARLGRPSTRIACVCEHCGKPFLAKANMVRQGGGHYCTRLCSNLDHARPLNVRFWARVNKNGPAPAHCPELGPCWLWTGGSQSPPYDYGTIHLDYRQPSVGAHRVSWELHFGPIPPGRCLLHRCDTPRCVNPAHLLVGTHADNSADMVKKGRSAWGERQHLAKLTVGQVAAIHAEYAAGGTSHGKLASKYGVEPSTIRAVLHGQTWKPLHGT